MGCLVTTAPGNSQRAGPHAKPPCRPPGEAVIRTVRAIPVLTPDDPTTVHASEALIVQRRTVSLGRSRLPGVEEAGPSVAAS